MLPDDSTDLFQRNMLDCYLDQPSKSFKNGAYKDFDQLCLAEILSYYYIVKKSVGNSENECLPVLLDDTIMESNHAKTHFLKIVPLMTFKENLHCRKVNAVLRYHQPSSTKHIKQYAHHLLFLFYPFGDEEQLRCPPFTGSYVMKLQEHGVIDIINRKRSIMEPFSEIVEEALANLTAHLTNPDAFSQQENDEVQAELASTANDLLDQEDETHSNLLFEESSLLPSYTAPILMSDNELNSKIQLLNQKQRKLFNKVQSWQSSMFQNKLRADPLKHEPLHIFLIGNASCRKSLLVRVIYQSVTKLLSYGSTLEDKPKALLMAPTGVAAINIDGTTIHTAFNIPVGHFGSNLPPLSDKIKSNLRNRLSELKIVIIDEMLMVSSNLLFYVRLRLN